MLFSPVFAAQQSAAKVVPTANGAPSAFPPLDRGNNRSPRPGRCASPSKFSTPSFDSSLFFSITSTLFFPTAFTQPFYFLSFPHSFQSNGGCTPSLSKFLPANRSSRSGRGHLFTLRGSEQPLNPSLPPTAKRASVTH